VAIFNPNVLSNPRLNCQLTYRLEGAMLCSPANSLSQHHSSKFVEVGPRALAHQQLRAGCVAFAGTGLPAICAGQLDWLRRKNHRWLTDANRVNLLAF
jgi:hypothetical protein